MPGYSLQNDMQTPPRRWANLFFGLKRCAMFCNVSLQKNLVLFLFLSNWDLHAFQKIKRKRKQISLIKMLQKICVRIFYSQHNLKRILLDEKYKIIGIFSAYGSKHFAYFETKKDGPFWRGGGRVYNLYVTLYDRATCRIEGMEFLDVASKQLQGNLRSLIWI